MEMNRNEKSREGLADDLADRLVPYIESEKDEHNRPMVIVNNRKLFRDFLAGVFLEIINEERRRL